MVGGGHSHVLLIRKWAMQALPGVRLTLISEKSDTPYSGMLPGLVAGHYSKEDVHIDLVRLCQWAGIRFIEQRVVAIDLENKVLSLSKNRPSVSFDVLSLDTGSTPELGVEGAREHSVPVKPVHDFYGRWQLLKSRFDSWQLRSQDESVRKTSDETFSVGVIGSGAGGFELVMAMQHALPSQAVTCHWFVRGQRPLKSRPEKVSDLALQAARQAGVSVHTEFDVVTVEHDSVKAGDGRVVSLQEIIWCTAARAPRWPGEAGLSIDARGFVFTNAYLQSISHDFVFATGDIGTQKETPSNKAGVFAVRQAPILFKNIRRYLLQQNLVTYKPQSDFLSLMATGEKSAIGNRGALTVNGPWVWRWKDSIDRKFMNQFRDLPNMKPRGGEFQLPKALLTGSSLSAKDGVSNAMRCSGCGGKVGQSILDGVLSELDVASGSEVITSFSERKDAAKIATGGEVLVQSVDQISAVCSDLHVFGRIAAVHALSDIYASGMDAHSAQALVTLPFADRQLVARDLTQLMSGVVASLNENDCTLIGGHTAEGSDVSLGFVVNGMQSVSGKADIELIAPQTGDAIILTKPIGTGVLLAGSMQLKAKGLDVQSVLAQMQMSNRASARIFQQNGVAAMTDVTGFGLLGHLQLLLLEMDMGANVDVSQVPCYRGAKALAQAGVASTLLSQNQLVLNEVDLDGALWNESTNLLCDPQTSGGLLGIVTDQRAAEVLVELQAAGFESACKIGTISDQPRLSLKL